MITNNLFDLDQEKETQPKEPDFEKGLNILSLFDGLSGGQIALDRLNIKVDNYYASEIDKYAIQVAKHNYPDTKHLGSVIDLKEEDLQKMNIDILIGGSPCQGFSVSGKMKGSSTACGIDVTSLEQYLQLKEEQFVFDGQSYLFWEYVRVWKIVKPKYFFLENVRVTKQWLPMFNEAMGVEPIMINSALLSAQNRVRFYWTNIPGVTQPKDKEILLRDILEEGVVDRDKSYCIDANYYKGGNLKQYFEKSRRQLVFRPCELRSFNKDSLCHHTATATATDINGQESIKRVYADTGKSPALTTMQGGHREPKILTVSEVTKPTYRKLTPLECERLQTLPEGYTSTVSNSQAYKMIGNGWTIDVICHIFKNITIEIPKNKKFASQQIDEKWISETFRIGTCVVSYTEEEGDYIWIYFAYSDRRKDFKKMVDFLKVKFYGKIIEYKTLKPLLFSNHSSDQKNGIYRWEH